MTRETYRTINAVLFTLFVGVYCGSFGFLACTNQQKKEAKTAIDVAQTACITFVGLEPELEEACILIDDVKDALKPLLKRQKKSRDAGPEAPVSAAPSASVKP
jgi:hypothetical protein